MDLENLNPQPLTEFQQGTAVIYGLYGKCSIISIETRSESGDQSLFYKLVPKKSAIVRKNQKTPAIWVPVNSAKEQGLRYPMTSDEANHAMTLLLSREYFFKPQEPWIQLLPKLEACIRTEGGIGLAKVASFLYILKRKLIVASSEINRFEELIRKMLLRELSEALKEPTKALEERMMKGFRSKMILDS